MSDMNPHQYPSTPVGKLYPTHPGLDESRYKHLKRRFRSQATSLAIDVGASSSPTYLPPQWSRHIQPEGKLYFYHDGLIATVTESWMYTPNIAAEAKKWIDLLTLRIKEKEIKLADVELCIRIDEDGDCLYYIVDRRNQTLFWLEDYETANLGLDDVVSPAHLRIALEAQFWLHIDRYPAHFGGLHESSLLKLLDIFIHARVDQITSLTSTFSYAPVDTEALLNLLNRCQGRTQESEVVSTIARAWHLVLHNRFYNQYGEETPRLDSTMTVLVADNQEQEGYSKSIMSFVTFKISEQYRVRMHSLCLDNYIRSHRVHAFVKSTLKEWKERFIMALLLFLCSNFALLLASQTLVSQTLAVASAVCFITSLLISFVLIQQYDGMLEHRNSTYAISWLGSHAQKKYRFQWLAFVFALPSALLNWGLVLFFCHWLHIGLFRLGLYTLICKGLQSMYCPRLDATYLPQGTRTPDPLTGLTEIGPRLVNQ